MPDPHLRSLVEKHERILSGFDGGATPLERLDDLTTALQGLNNQIEVMGDESPMELQTIVNVSESVSTQTVTTELGTVVWHGSSGEAFGRCVPLYMKGDGLFYRWNANLSITKLLGLSNNAVSGSGKAATCTYTGAFTFDDNKQPNRPLYVTRTGSITQGRPSGNFVLIGMMKDNRDALLTGAVGHTTVDITGAKHSKLDELEWSAAGHTMDATLDMDGQDITMGTGTLDMELGPINNAADVFVEDGGQVGISGNELLTFNAAGNIVVSGANFGIGSTPSHLLHVIHSAANQHLAHFEDSAAHGLQIVGWSSGVNFDPITADDNIYIGRDNDLGIMHVETGSIVMGYAGAGATAKLDVVLTDAEPSLALRYYNTDNAYDPQVHLYENTTAIWAFGMDTGQSNRFVLTPGTAIGNQTTGLLMDTSGNTTLSGTLTMGGTLDMDGQSITMGAGLLDTEGGDANLGGGDLLEVNAITPSGSATVFTGNLQIGADGVAERLVTIYSDVVGKSFYFHNHGDWVEIKSNLTGATALDFRTAAGGGIAFDCGGNYIFRDVDDSYATRLTIASATGNITMTGVLDLNGNNITLGGGDVDMEGGGLQTVSVIDNNGSPVAMGDVLDLDGNNLTMGAGTVYMESGTFYLDGGAVLLANDTGQPYIQLFRSNASDANAVPYIELGKDSSDRLHLEPKFNAAGKLTEVTFNSLSGGGASAAGFGDFVFEPDNVEALRVSPVLVNSKVPFQTTQGVIRETDRITSNTTLDTTHHQVFCDTDGGAFTVTLPAGVDGTEYRIINTGSAGLDVTVTPDGAELLFGANSSDTVSDDEVIVIVYETTEGWA